MHIRNLFYIAIIALTGCLNVPFIPMVDALMENILQIRLPVLSKSPNRRA